MLKAGGEQIEPSSMSSHSFAHSVTSEWLVCKGCSWSTLKHFSKFMVFILCSEKRATICHEVASSLHKEAAGEDRRVVLCPLLFSECVLLVPSCPLFFSSRCPLTCVQFRVDVFSRPKIGKREQIASIYQRATKSGIVNKQAEICFSRISQPSNLLLWIFSMHPCS